MDINHLPQQRNKKGKIVHSGQRKFIINIYNDKKAQFPNTRYKEIIKLVGNICGVGYRTVADTLKEFKRTETVTSPSKKRVKPDIMQKMSEEEIGAIRKHVHAFWERRKLPTVPRVLAAIRRDENLPIISQNTLQRLLKKMNFKYVQRQRNSALIEREDIIRWRRTFITKIREFRAAGRPIYYLDETWVNAGDTRQRVWVDNTLASNARERGLTENVMHDVIDATVSRPRRLTSEDGSGPFVRDFRA